MKDMVHFNNNTFKSEKIFTKLMLVVLFIVCISFCGHATSKMKVSKNSEEYAKYMQKALEILESLEPWLPIELDYIKSMDFEFREWYSFGQNNVTISCYKPMKYINIKFTNDKFVMLNIENSEHEKEIIDISEEINRENLKAANEIIQIFDDSLQFDIHNMSYFNSTSTLDTISEYTSWSVMKYYEYNGMRYGNRYSLVSLYPAESLVRLLIYMPAKYIPDTKKIITDTEAQEIAKKSLLSHEYNKVETLDELVAYDKPELCVIDRPLYELYLSSTSRNMVIPEGYVKSDLESSRLYWKVELYRIVTPYLKYVVYIDAQNSIVLSTDISSKGTLPKKLTE